MKTVDCLLIGHNEMQFEAYEKNVRLMGPEHGAYRDLNLNFVQYQHKPYTAADVFNTFCYGDPALDNRIGPLSLGNVFSLTIAALGSFLHKHGFSFDYVNSFQEEKKALADKLQKDHILTIAVLTTLYVSVLPILEIISFIKTYNPEAKIIVGGPLIATQIKTMQEKQLVDYLFKTIGADFYINSAQGEGALARLIHAVKNDLPWENINNLTYLHQNRFYSTPIKMEDNKLEDNPIDWNLFADRVGKFAAIRTSISCPFSCAFCGFPQHAGKYQTANVDYVEAELDLLARVTPVESIMFIDDTFNIPPNRFKDLLKMLIKNKYRFRWSSHFRCQYAEPELLELMKESGCEGVFLGIESGSQRILDIMNKSVSIEKYRRGLSLLNEAGLTSYASFIIGFPGETEATVQETINFIETTQPAFFRTQLWYCDPLTPIWQDREKYQINNSHFEWSHATMDAPTACDLIDEIFLTIKNSIWVPQYNFEFYTIFNLLRRGMNLTQISRFLNSFNSGVKEKLQNPGQTELSSLTLQKLQTIVNQAGNEPVLPETGPDVNKYGADFDFS